MRDTNINAELEAAEVFVMILLMKFEQREARLSLAWIALAKS